MPDFIYPYSICDQFHKNFCKYLMPRNRWMINAICKKGFYRIYVAPAEEAVAPQIAPNNGDLVYGMTSDEIYYIQLILNLLGYDVGALDGYFGDVTLEAVKAFQRDFGLYVDGIIGAQTKAALGIQ